MLKICSIFDSIDGEYNGWDGPGCPTTFIRLQGCNLSCKWCDTKYAQPIPMVDGEGIMTTQAIIDRVKHAKVTITGGEPLLQQDGLIELLCELSLGKHYVTVETNGSIPVRPFKGVFNYRRFDENSVRYVIDRKLVSSGEADRMRIHPEDLDMDDTMKFVIDNKTDLEEALILAPRVPGYAIAVFSPAWKDSIQNTLKWAAYIAEQMLKFSKSNYLLSLQYHKLLWPDTKKEV